ncbi:HepT-like ribonuclease domain-containing protein [Aureimonas leprariae]|uniref:DUF86 domain-containing protein n=1 Tax=Plantimonas leprariae TaxID=2615207 RepID=A0A7V7PSS6_9HYPH|nr:HepT-like ribonuclease domain-containing protein [Aureimonas leprariae]KAB0682640.1 DUF86 domain-containing protein [Aureimonas leprariae]
MTEKDDSRPYLRDILTWGGRLAAHVAGSTQDAFLRDDQKQDAVLYCLTVIGEASGQVLKRSPGLSAQAAGFDLKQAHRMRNVAAHGYSSVDYGTVWETAVRDVPRLVEHARRLHLDD